MADRSYKIEPTPSAVNVQFYDSEFQTDGVPTLKR